MSETITGGNTYIGKGCYFGLRCIVINKLNLTNDCTFGAGAVIVKDATESGTYVSVPAKMIKPLQK
jgi:acetyltransferase-like isoleucine patch superfamily enzyme